MGVKDSFLGRLLGNADKFSEEQVAQTVSLLVEHGVKRGASDIHIEPHERVARVRYRIDNVLRGVHKLPLAALPAVVEQIKVIARMHPEEFHLPQEGQYATLVGEDQFEIQVATMPVVGGEKVVLHISRRLGKPLSLEELGFWGQGLVAIQTALSRTHGLIAVTTPRRNGKTTTLHSLLRLVTVPSFSIATVEDSIEYRRRTSGRNTASRFIAGFRLHFGKTPTLS
jgi:type II secretory ATPase GspE/PulE/Tfp pilus assembly ATPase PilB-like protein